MIDHARSRLCLLGSYLKKIVKAGKLSDKRSPKELNNVTALMQRKREVQEFAENLFLLGDQPRSVPQMSLGKTCR
tara:strand:- start:180 stop:404 length:225 start_codon:yes stop_codon:yes gene_type:complete